MGQSTCLDKTMSQHPDYRNSLKRIYRKYNVTIFLTVLCCLQRLYVLEHCDRIIQHFRYDSLLGDI